MHRMLHTYKLASLAGMLVAAALLVLLYRAVAVEEIVQLAQRSNLALAHTALNAVKPELIEYLTSVSGVQARQVAEQELPERLGAVIAGLMQDTTVARIKIYNRRGVVVYSTKPDQAGEAQEDNGGFDSAIKGKIASKLVYSGAFSFGRGTEDDNLMSTYIPVRRSAADPVQGVFEIYTDVDDLIAQNEQAIFKILAGIGLVLAFLYFVLLSLAGRATRAIESQELTVRELSATLQGFYAQLLQSEEMAKKEIVADLHKSLALTLDAIKILLKLCSEQVMPASANWGTGETIIGMLRSTVREIQSIAKDLQQFKPDEFGLGSAVDLFCGRFEQLYPGNLIEQHVLPSGSGAPERQKIVMYRIIESAFKNMAQFADADQIQILLRRSSHSPAIENTGQASHDAATAQGGAAAQRHAGLAQMLGRMTPSEGTFSARRTDAGGIMLSASWTK